MLNNWEAEIINAIEYEVSIGISERRNSDFKYSKRNARWFTNLKKHLNSWSIQLILESYLNYKISAEFLLT